jgi:hypothetical protein
MEYVILAWDNHEARGVPLVYGTYPSFISASAAELQISAELTVIEAIVLVKR